MFYNIIYFFFFLSIFLNLNFFFLNEETLIFFSIAIFFFFLYKSSSKFITLFFFKKIEYIYIIFFYLLYLSIKLINLIDKYIYQYDLYLNSFLHLDLNDLILNKLFIFFNIEKNINIKLNNYSILNLILKIFILEKYFSNMNIFNIKFNIEKENSLFLYLKFFENKLFNFFFKKF